MTRAVLFDLDDTLYPYAPCNEAGKRAAWAAAVDRGYDLDRESFDEAYRAARREVKLEIPTRAASHERYLYCKRLVERRAGEPRPADALALGEAFWAAYLDEMTLFEGVADVLAALAAAGVAVALVTDLTARIQLTKVDRLGIAGHLDELVTSEETGREKPSALMFALPLARLDVRPSEAVAVGDSVAADVRGGNAAGLTTVLFDHEGTDVAPDGALPGDRRPDHRIGAFDELLDVVADG
ncbi:MAG: HAD family hydrolase [Haloferacaceae archaeon]